MTHRERRGEKRESDEEAKEGEREQRLLLPLSLTT